MKHLKLTLYSLGFLLISISGFMTFSSQVITINEDPGFASVPLIGFNSALWFDFLFFAIVLTALAQSMNSLAMKTVFYIVFGLGSLITAYVAFVSSFSWGGPIHPSLESGATVGFLGLLLIVVTGILFIPSSLVKSSVSGKQKLLLIGVYMVLLSTAFLPFEGSTSSSEANVTNGIDRQLFFIYWIFGLALLVLGFRKTLFSKIITCVIIGLSFLAYLHFEYGYSFLLETEYLFGAYLSTAAYLTIVIYAIYSLYKKEQKRISD